MPAELDACVKKVMAEGKDESSAFAICNATIGGSNFVSYELDSKGDLYLKYFFADGSYAKRSPTDGFNLYGAAIPDHDNEAAGLPFSILPSKSLSVFGDYHPWHPDLGKASWEKHVEFANQFAPGHLVRLTAESAQQGNAQDVIKNNGRFAIVKIDHAGTRDAYLKDNSLIPRAVSPGFLNLEAPNKTDIKNFKWTHLAAVPQGAYGDKATLYASCVGGDSCVDKLVGASVLEESKKPYCPIGASELLTSHDISNEDTYQMSDNANTVQSTPPVQQAQPTTAAPPAQTGALTTAPTTAAPARLKLAGQPVTNPQQPQNAINLEEFDKVRKQVEELKAKEAEVARIEGLKGLVPREIFILPNQKFDEKGYESDVTKLVKAGFDPANPDHQALIQEHYKNKAELVKYTMQNTNPLGGSYNYQTPSHVATPEGGSAAAVELTADQKTAALFKMWGLR